MQCDFILHNYIALPIFAFFSSFCKRLFKTKPNREIMIGERARHSQGCTKGNIAIILCVISESAVALSM